MSLVRTTDPATSRPSASKSSAHSLGNALTTQWDGAPYPGGATAMVNDGPATHAEAAAGYGIMRSARSGPLVRRPAAPR